MPSHERLRRAFVALHLVLGLGLFILSARAAVGAPADSHVLPLAGLEAVAAILFLLPRTLRLGAGLLMATLAVAIVLHVLRGEWPGALPIYAAAVLFVAVHGSAYRPRVSDPAAAR